jgi:hypothetical protein
MAGFDAQALARITALPPEIKPLVLIALGRKGDKELLDEKDRVREFPNSRKTVEEFCFAGKFGETHPGIIPAESLPGMK